MMNWLFFALLAPAVYATVNFIDKYIVEREVTDPRGLVIFTAILSSLSGTLFWVIGGFPILKLQDTALILFTGMMTIIAAIFYFEAMSREAASNIIVFLQTTPVVVFVLSLLFLGEVLAPDRVVGFVLILGAAVGVSLKRGAQAFQPSAAFFLILGTAFFQGLALVLFKLISGSIAFIEVLSYESWGIALGGIILYLFVPIIRHSFNRNLTTMRRRGFAAIVLNESIFILAKTLAFVAVSLGSATLVSVLNSSGIFYGIVFGWLLTLLSPTIFKEDISRTNLVRKGVLASVLFVGILLVN